MLEQQRPGHRHRRHCSGQREGGDDARLAVAGQVDDAERHRRVDLVGHQFDQA